MLGGAGYVLIELLWRRRSHISMFIAGGSCFLLLFWLNGSGLPFIVQCVIAGLGITVVEFIVGCIVNLWLRLNVWDYSRRKYNVYGQVCLMFTVLWMVLSFAVLSIIRLV